MELIGSLFLVLALMLVVGLFVARPFLFKKTGDAGQSSEDMQDLEHQRSALLAERDRALNALQELDFDFALEKIPADEYPLQRAALLKAGTDALRKLDELEASKSSRIGVAESVEDRIERAVAARRADAARARQQQPRVVGAAQPAGVAAGMVANGKNHGADALEELIATRKRERKESTAGFCPRCGKPASKSDKFCSKCGAKL